MQTRSPHIIALGGSIVAPEGVNVSFIKRFAKLIQDDVRKGQRFVIVVGGGGISREYQKSATKISKNITTLDKDLIGIRATQLNAEMVRAVFAKNAYSQIVTSPKQLKETQKPIVISSGWSVGNSTDTIAVRIAQILNVKRVINAGRPAFVYDSDPAINKKAKPFKKMTWKEYGKIVSGPWRPGMSAPVDPVAARLVRNHNISVIVLDGTKLTNLRRALRGRPFHGTVIEGS